jgi:hypothetical protein
MRRFAARELRCGPDIVLGDSAQLEYCSARSGGRLDDMLGSLRQPRPPFSSDDCSSLLRGSKRPFCAECAL